ncbi:THAP domain-containing protein 3 [Fukomys damarensis]|uniref:THAP domain-containing protein 3 n=1 Tax=Fukomys damarensis TaxID=885580 RepID=UPI001455B86B|nr:THAP domain-containing protein 3 [Fukomys damarensis]
MYKPVFLHDRAKTLRPNWLSHFLQGLLKRFPFSRPELLKEWVLNIGRADFQPKQHSVICSEHFRPECFSAFGNRKNLKHNAVPTVFAFQEPTQVCPEVGAGEDATPEELQPPSVRSPALQVQRGGLCHQQDGGARPPCQEQGGRDIDPGTWALLPRPGTSEAPGAPASGPGPGRPPPRQLWDHSYALLDLAALKKKLFLTLRENERLRRQLKARRLVMRRGCSRLRAHRGPRPEPPR